MDYTYGCQQTGKIMTVDWQPIETAPKDQKIYLMFWRDGAFDVGSYCADKYAKNPKPYWNSWKIQLGITWMRKNVPTHWAPFPQGPNVSTPRP
jgi:hypothetical protein